MSADHRTARVSVSALVNTCVVLCAAQAAAQSTRELQVLEEITVTATKRAEKLQDVPISMSAISADDIQARGFTNYADYLNAVPGAFFQDEGPGASSIRIRGISAAETGVPSTTATYFGETLTSVTTVNGGKPNLRLVDIDRVEVLRGPQGTLFGASALAGVVRVIPAGPDLSSFEANVGLRGYSTAHSDDASYHLEGTVNIPLVPDRLALRVVGYQDDIAGYIDNVTTDQPPVDYSAALGLPAGTLVTPAIAALSRQDINSEDTWGARAALTWQATDRFKIDLTYATQDATANGEPTTLPSAGEYLTYRPLDAFEQGSSGEQLDIATLVLNYDGDAVSLLSASSWSTLERFAVRDITSIAEIALGVPIPWSLRQRDDGELFTQEMRVQSRSDGPLRWLAGAFYLKQEANVNNSVPDYSCPTCLPAVLFGQNFALDVPKQQFSEEEQRAVFAELSYTIAERWTLGVGARYLEDEVTRFFPFVSGLLVGGEQLEEEPIKGPAYEFNPSAYLRYEASDDMTLYAQAARGFRSGIANQELPDDCLEEAAQFGVKPITDPDSLWNYELGMKMQLAGGRLAVNAAVYRQEWQGVQLGQTLSCGFSVAVNGGDAINDGVELELVAQPTDAWRFNLAASYNSSEFDKVREETGFVENERLPDVPEKNYSAGAQYDFNLGADWTAFIRADYVYVGEIRLKFGTDVLSQESFDTANLRLAFQRDALAIELFGRNLADERGVVTTLDPQQGGRKEVLVRPREVGVELRYSFR